MEMQQIRYFLALSRTLNFTRAAEECNVSQSALTRAVKALEGELGGELIRREGNRSHLTELGKRMLPFMQRCFDSALSAKSLAKSIAQDDVVPLSVSVSNTVNAEALMDPITEMFRAFPGLQLKLLRGGAPEIIEALKQGEVEVAIAGPLEDDWDRLDSWPLYEERYEIAVKDGHPLALENEVTLEKLAGYPVFCIAGCEMRDAFDRLLAERGLANMQRHETITHQDLSALVSRGVGIAFVPESVGRFDNVRRVHVDDLPITRQVRAYAVAGRQRPIAAATFLNLLRSADFALA